MNNQQRILAEVGIERMQQDMQWGGPEHDDQHGPGLWVNLITKFLGRAASAFLSGIGSNWLQYRDSMIKVAAVAVAAVEVGDRRYGEPKREASTYGFHAKGGWWFSRVGDEQGSVQVIHTDETGAYVLGTVDLDGNLWASVVASMSKYGETGETYQAARAFHQGAAIHSLSGVHPPAGQSEVPGELGEPAGDHNGSDLLLKARNDAGDTTGSAMAITRATMAATFGGAVSATGGFSGSGSGLTSHNGSERDLLLRVVEAARNVDRITSRGVEVSDDGALIYPIEKRVGLATVLACEREFREALAALDEHRAVQERPSGWGARMDRELLDAAGRIRERAEQLISDLCNSRRTWSMSVPARLDDPDILLSEALFAMKRMEDEIRRLWGDRDNGQAGQSIAAGGGAQP